MNRIESLFILAALCLGGAGTSVAAQVARNPYAGSETRRIKSLSDDQIAGYLEGQGVSLALPAELNHYPGPRHVIDLADSLRLTPLQRRRVDSVSQAMRQAAIPLGREYVSLEAALDSLFAHRAINATLLAEQLRKSEAVLARLRYMHLEAHLAVRTILTNEQVAAYDRLRGYGHGASGHSSHKPEDGSAYPTPPEGAGHGSRNR